MLLIYELIRPIVKAKALGIHFIIISLSLVFLASSTFLLRKRLEMLDRKPVQDG